MASQWNSLIMLIVNVCVTQIVVSETRPQVYVQVDQNRRLGEWQDAWRKVVQFFKEFIPNNINMAIRKINIFMLKE